MRRTTYAFLCLEGALLSFNVAACAALVPSIAKEFALSQFITGKIIWLYMLPYGAAALLYGPLVRSIDAKRVELVCIFCFSCANLLAGLSRNINTLFAARFLMGVFGASVVPLALILIARDTPSQERGKAVGIFFSVTFFASLMGLLLSAIIPWRLIFLIPAGFGFLLLIHMHWYMPSFSGGLTRFKINYLEIVKDKTIVSIFTYIFLISLLYHGVQQWLGVYFSQEFRFSQAVISMLFTLTSLSGIFGEAFGGWWADKIGRTNTITIGLLFMVASTFALIARSALPVLVFIMIIWGLGWTCNHAGVSTLLTDLPKESLHEAASLNSSIRFISGGLGVALGGILMQQGFAWGFLVFGSCLLGLLFFSKFLLTSGAPPVSAVKVSL